ncbi:hypothetical protein BP6252_09554 [Coleophoma cylindrospora]|uniref:Uncharacterized protein n=1 Tax=Coleophoma cylindrospora TaxID=1849047 RepID=A0A3D8R2I3_9HELO|nr:hypothetical protein BP6252_09554 [Coleophoma cylindrospora]
MRLKRQDKDAEKKKGNERAGKAFVEAKPPARKWWNKMRLPRQKESAPSQDAAAMFSRHLENPPLSRASTLSSTDMEYLTTRATRSGSRTPSQPMLRSAASSPAIKVDWDAFAGAFEPKNQFTRRNYPASPLTERQLHARQGAFTPSGAAPASPVVGWRFG